MFGKPPIPNANERPGSEREWRLIEKLLEKSLDEQRNARRWGYFFKMAFLAYLVVVLVVMRPSHFVETDLGDQPLTALVDVYGPIMQEEYASAEYINASLRKAFEYKHTKAIVLRVNSPGGSPVQAGYVYDEIKRLRALHEDKKVYAVIEDLGASAAYYIASAADEIYADKASLVGSIGVIGGGFGFVEAMKKLGVERRIYTSGQHKAFLDPFQPEKKSEKAFWESVLKTTHEQFIDQVKLGRGERLKQTPELFSGLIWPGETALELGLIDGLGSASFVAREKIGVEKSRNFSFQEDPIQRFIKELGMSAGAGIAKVMGLDQTLSLH